METQNNININVFGYGNKQPFPIYISKKYNNDIMNSLLIPEETKQHVYIKDFNKFTYNQTKHKERKNFCMYCLQALTTNDVLIKHQETCLIITEKQAIKMPEKDNILKFNNFYKQLNVPFVIYADFEAITQKIQTLLQIMINHILKPIKSMLMVVMDIKWYVVMMINIANL